MREDAFRVEGRVMEALPNGTFLAELGNGHRLTAFVESRDSKIFAGLKAGDVVKLQLTPYDLSVGRILNMKVRASVKKLCEHCKIVRRRGVIRVICSNKRHKQRQG